MRSSKGSTASLSNSRHRGTPSSNGFASAGYGSDKMINDASPGTGSQVDVGEVEANCSIGCHGFGDSFVETRRPRGRLQAQPWYDTIKGDSRGGEGVENENLESLFSRKGRPSDLREQETSPSPGCNNVPTFPAQGKEPTHPSGDDPFMESSISSQMLKMLESELSPEWLQSSFLRSIWFKESCKVDTHTESKEAVLMRVDEMEEQDETRGFSDYLLPEDHKDELGSQAILDHLPCAEESRDNLTSTEQTMNDFSHVEESQEDLHTTQGDLSGEEARDMKEGGVLEDDYDSDHTPCESILEDEEMCAESDQEVKQLTHNELCLPFQEPASFHWQKELRDFLSTEREESISVESFKTNKPKRQDLESNSTPTIQHGDAENGSLSMLNNHDKILIRKVKSYYESYEVDEENKLWTSKKRESMSLIPLGAVRNSIFRQKNQTYNSGNMADLKPSKRPRTQALSSKLTPLIETMGAQTCSAETSCTRVNNLPKDVQCENLQDNDADLFEPKCDLSRKLRGHEDHYPWLESPRAETVQDMCASQHAPKASCAGAIPETIRTATATDQNTIHQETSVAEKSNSACFLPNTVSLFIHEDGEGKVKHPLDVIYDQEMDQAIVEDYPTTQDDNFVQLAEQEMPAIMYEAIPSSSHDSPQMSATIFKEDIRDTTHMHTSTCKKMEDIRVTTTVECKRTKAKHEDNGVNIQMGVNKQKTNMGSHGEKGNVKGSREKMQMEDAGGNMKKKDNTKMKAGNGKNAKMEHNDANAETEDNGTKDKSQGNIAEMKTEGNGAETKVVVKGADTKMHGNSAATKTEGNGAEMNMKGNGAETKIKGNGAEMEGKGSSKKTKAECKGPETKAEDNGAKTKAEDNRENMKIQRNNVKTNPKDKGSNTTVLNNCAKIKAQNKDVKCIAQDNHTETIAQDNDTEHMVQDNGVKTKEQDNDANTKVQNNGAKTKVQAIEATIKGQDNAETTKGQDNVAKTKVQANVAKTKGQDNEATTKGQDNEATTKGQDNEATTKGQDNEATTKGHNNGAMTKWQDNAEITKGQDNAETTKGQDNAETTKGQDNAETTKGKDNAETTKGQDNAETTKGQDTGPATKGQGNGAATKGQDNGTVTKGQDNGAMTKGKDNGPATKGQDNGPATKGQDNGTVTKGQEKETVIKGQDNGPMTKGQGNGATAMGQEKETVTKGQDNGPATKGLDNGTVTRGQDNGATTEVQDNGAMTKGQDKGTATIGQDKRTATNGQDNGTVTKGQDNGTVTKGQDNGVMTKGQDNGAMTNGQGNGAMTMGQEKETVIKGQDNGPMTKGQDNGTVTKGKDNGATTKGQDNGAMTMGQDNGATTMGQEKEAVTKGQGNGTVTKGQDNRPAAKEQDKRVTGKGPDKRATTKEQDNRTMTKGQDNGPVTNGQDSGPVTNGQDNGTVTNGLDNGPVTNGQDNGPVTNGQDNGTVTKGQDNGVMTKGKDNKAASKGPDKVATMKEQDNRAITKGQGNVTTTERQDKGARTKRQGNGTRKKEQVNVATTKGQDNETPTKGQDNGRKAKVLHNGAIAKAQDDKENTNTKQNLAKMNKVTNAKTNMEEKSTKTNAEKNSAKTNVEGQEGKMNTGDMPSQHDVMQDSTSAHTFPHTILVVPITNKNVTAEIVMENTSNDLDISQRHLKSFQVQERNPAAKECDLTSRQNENDSQLRRKASQQLAALLEQKMLESAAECEAVGHKVKISFALPNKHEDHVKMEDAHNSCTTPVYPSSKLSPASSLPVLTSSLGSEGHFKGSTGGQHQPSSTSMRISSSIVLNRSPLAQQTFTTSISRSCSSGLLLPSDSRTQNSLQDSCVLNRSTSSASVSSPFSPSLQRSRSFAGQGRSDVFDTLPTACPHVKEQWPNSSRVHIGVSEPDMQGTQGLTAALQFPPTASATNVNCRKSAADAHQCASHKTANRHCKKLSASRSMRNCGSCTMPDLSKGWTASIDETADASSSRYSESRNRDDRLMKRSSRVSVAMMETHRPISSQEHDSASSNIVLQDSEKVILLIGPGTHELQNDARQQNGFFQKRTCSTSAVSTFANSQEPFSIPSPPQRVRSVIQPHTQPTPKLGPRSFSAASIDSLSQLERKDGASIDIPATGIRRKTISACVNFTANGLRVPVDECAVEQASTVPNEQDHDRSTVQQMGRCHTGPADDVHDHIQALQNEFQTLGSCSET
uniref:extracellular matrix-binding protein EbhA-like n=1 Tax=Myxine glutinosa TaxID=7769 RepID=UPI00358EEC6A